MIHIILKILGIQLPTTSGYKSRQEKDNERRESNKATQ